MPHETHLIAPLPGACRSRLDLQFQATRLPSEFGMPFAQTLDHERVPPQMVKLRGRNGVRFVPLEQWQAKAERERIVDLLSDFPTPVY